MIILLLYGKHPRKGEIKYDIMWLVLSLLYFMRWTLFGLENKLFQMN